MSQHLFFSRRTIEKKAEHTEKYSSIHPSAARPSSKLKDPSLSAPSSRRVRLYRENICPENYLLGGAPLMFKKRKLIYRPEFQICQGGGEEGDKKGAHQSGICSYFLFLLSRKGACLERANPLIFLE
jgi:hypothetical protein